MGVDVQAAPAVLVENVVKRYGNGPGAVTVLRDATIEVAKGEIGQHHVEFVDLRPAGTGRPAHSPAPAARQENVGLPVSVQVLERQVSQIRSGRIIH